MGVLVVHCPNRPQDELIDCGVYGFRENMHSHNVDTIDKDVVIGAPLPSGKKLPAAEAEDEKLIAKINVARAQAVGAVLSKEFSGIKSTDLPGGVITETPQKEAPSAADKQQKSAQAKTGGE